MNPGRGGPRRGRGLRAAPVGRAARKPRRVAGRRRPGAAPPSLPASACDGRGATPHRSPSRPRLLSGPPCESPPRRRARSGGSIATTVGLAPRAAARRGGIERRAAGGIREGLPVGPSSGGGSVRPGRYSATTRTGTETARGARGSRRRARSCRCRAPGPVRRRAAGVEGAEEIEEQERRGMRRAGDPLHGGAVEVADPHADRVAAREADRPRVAMPERGPRLPRDGGRAAGAFPRRGHVGTPRREISLRTSVTSAAASGSRDAARARGSRLCRASAASLRDGPSRRSSIASRSSAGVPAGLPLGQGA
jgi:hypothetical protein